MDTRDALQDELLGLKGYNYQIWDYNLSHSILTIRATHEQKKHQNIHITFVDVRYFQFPHGWAGDLHPASDDELIEILVRAGVGRLDKAVPISYVKERFSLYKADSPNCTIYILGKLSTIEHDVEPIYDR
jgi:hypothetical protein